MRSIFVTGTDTGVGKTTICQCLVRYLRQSGCKAVYQKWIETGCRYSETNPQYPYRFRKACSPHLAARIERRKIDPAKIKASFRELEEKFGCVVVEGIGGALVPYDSKNLVIDIARELDLPVLLVAGNKLGAINHTLLTLEALKSRKLEILGIIFNNFEKQDRIVLKDNPRIVKKLSGVKVLGIFPWISGRKKI